MSNTKLNKTREMLVNKYIEALEKEELPWEKTWNVALPRNAVTGTPYRGANSLLLSFIAYDRGYSGNRWCTFNQIADREGKYHPNEPWHLKKGSKSVPVEYWYVFDCINRKHCSFEEYNKIIKEDISRLNDFKLCSNTYLVFNEDCIEGISKDMSLENKEIDKLEVIDNIINNMKVGYSEYGDQAYYNPVTDEVVIPPMEHFKTEYGYCATQLHELCHATGHIDRLGRAMINKFGTPEYAIEELRAEIGSSFLMQELNLQHDESHINNHIAYVQNWIEVLKKDPNELFRAVKDAESIVEYIEKVGEIDLAKLAATQQDYDDYEK